MAGGDPNAMGGDPGMGEDPGLGGMGDPVADGNPNDMGGEDMPMSDQDEGSDSTMDIINQLSPTDREAVRSYAESMLSRDETSGGMEPEQAPEAAPQDQNIMMEITKGRLIKAQKKINEMFGDMVTGNDKDETDRTEKKVRSNRRNFKSPFDSPRD